MSFSNEVNLLTLHFNKKIMQNRFISHQLTQNRHFFSYGFPILMLALAASLANDALGNGHTNLLISKAAVLSFAMALTFLCKCFPRLYLNAG